MDDSGYCATLDDLAVLRIKPSAIRPFQIKQCPLGMETATYSYFLSSLGDALKADKLADADVRLQGSYAHFFSGVHKPMPYSRDELYREFMNRFRHLDAVPTRHEIDRALLELEQHWPSSNSRPTRIMFDALYEWLRIDPNPSDYDVQVSSAQLYGRCLEWVTDQLDQSPFETDYSVPEYRFLQKKIVTLQAPHLDLWAKNQTRMLHRVVTVAAFPGDGPPRSEGQMSSHFRTNDWILFGPDLS